jgi:thiol-disulfide isomerase/thioredoxin
VKPAIWVFTVVFAFANLSFQILPAQPRMVKFSAVDSLLSNHPDSVVVLNFWATWCKPCINELPYFEKLHKNYGRVNVKVVLVSLDFKKEFESRLKQFTEKNKIQASVLLLDEPDHNSWINRVDSSWSGAIPATVIVHKNKKLFFEKEFSSYAELENIVKPLTLK